MVRVRLYRTLRVEVERAPDRGSGGFGLGACRALACRIELGLEALHQHPFAVHVGEAQRPMDGRQGHCTACLWA